MNGKGVLRIGSKVIGQKMGGGGGGGEGEGGRGL